MSPGKTTVSEQTYFVEKILSRRIREDGEYEYFVKWEVSIDLDFHILCLFL